MQANRDAAAPLGNTYPYLRDMVAKGSIGGIKCRTEGITKIDLHAHIEKGKNHV